MNRKNVWKINLILLLIVAVIVIAPMFIKKGAEFGGADGQGMDAISEISPDYKPWFSHIWEPPSGEIESLMFALQAALGSGVVFFVIGYYMGRKNVPIEKDDKENNSNKFKESISA